MAECKDCIHYDMCKYRPLAIGVDICDVFRNTADVVPKSEVEELIRENESLAKTVNEASELIRKLRSKIDELKKDRYQVLPDGRLELLPRTDIDKIKTEVAREIFADLQGLLIMRIGVNQAIAELKKKYTESCTECRHFVGCESAVWTGPCDSRAKKRS